ncbi:hypothetical protein [Rhabdochromatium marinum]|uniref:hypothetical protein n=1 Tax=Rhabdochromatium marinum TaxID=48729 RepID=UPI0019089B6E|nr:hypothetical protein [Rhabdochromatium marinum]MBK1648381.1 hypothetical protein [Rhabdochromatium marinum]
MTEYHDRIKKVGNKCSEISQTMSEPHYLHVDLYTYSDGRLNLRIDGNLDHAGIEKLSKVFCYLHKVLKDEPPSTTL